MLSFRGDDDEEQGKNHPDHQQDTDQQADRPAGFVLPGTIAFPPKATPAPFHRTQDHIHQEGQAAPQKKGEEEGEEPADKTPGLAGVGEHPIEHHPEGDEQHETFGILSV